MTAWGRWLPNLDLRLFVFWSPWCSRFAPISREPE